MLKRAASSIPLNTSEGMRFRDGNRRQRLQTAAGSADEVFTILHVAAAWGYISEQEIAEPADLIDQIQAILYTLIRK